MQPDRLDELAAAALAHRDLVARRYGPDSYQVRSAERAIAQIERARAA